MNHHEFSPSRLEQYRICPGAHKMQKGILEKESEWAEEGKLLHHAVEIGDVSILQNDEQKEVVERCFDFICERASSRSEIHHEEKVDITYNGTLLTFGYADIIIKDSDALSVIDLKFGWNPVKNVSENIQLATYAVGAMQKYGFSSCDCWVFQPRIHNKSHYLFTNPEAIVSNIQTIIKRAKDEKLVLNATEESCRYCCARLNCPAFRLEFQRLAAVKNDCDLSDIPTLVSLFDASKEVKSFINEIEAEVRKVIEAKGQCGKYGFQISEGSRQVKDLNALYARIKDWVTPQEFNNICSVTLGKMESLVADKLIADAQAKGEKLGKEAAKKSCFVMIQDLITRGTPTKKIVEMA